MKRHEPSSGERVGVVPSHRTTHEDHIVHSACGPKLLLARGVEEGDNEVLGGMRWDRYAKVLSALEERVGALEAKFADIRPSVEIALRRRGLSVAAMNPLERVILPRLPAPDAIDRYYQDLKRYYFRRILQEVAERGGLDASALSALSSRWGEAATSRYLRQLVGYRILEPRNNGYTFSFPHIHSLGDTLEWFVAQVFGREFASPAAWGVKLRDLRLGGDFDVLVHVEHLLGYVECKSSPPYNVTVHELRQFLDRRRRLGPDFAILLLDTTLKIERNIVENLRWLWRETSTQPFEVSRLFEGIYHVSPDVYLVTSRRSLVFNLGRCLRHRFKVAV